LLECSLGQEDCAVIDFSIEMEKNKV
jgi:hypothetical protein